MGSKQKTSAKRKSYQENDLHGKTMILFELQLTEHLDQKLKQYRIETHKLTKRSKVLCHHVKEKVQKFYKPGSIHHHDAYRNASNKEYIG